MKTPWNSIAESITTVADKQILSAAQAMASPCLTCPTTPCCTHLPLNTFKVTNMVELDHALYLLNFDRIELGISASGDWSSYYAYPCRLLDRETHRCTVHNTPEQPRICIHYNPYNCWYQRIFSVGQNQEFVRIDTPRMRFLLQYIELNEQRQIVSVPAWDDLVKLMTQFEDQTPEPVSEPNLADDAITRWEQSVLHSGQSPEPEKTSKTAYDASRDPCVGCEAYCCKTLVFPQAFPQIIANLDYYRFALGYPGIELGISDGGWSIVLKTTCRHLDAENRCSIYDQPERPLICRYYDAWKCDYKGQYGQTRPAGYLRLRFEHFTWAAESLSFDAEGTIVDLPSTEALRQQIESRWRQYAMADQ